jgi:hypothetical protein
MMLVKVGGDESRGVLRRSRIVKTMADIDAVRTFSEGEDLLRSVVVRIGIDEHEAGTLAGQAALLTVARTCLKCFESVSVEGPLDGSLRLPIFGAQQMTLREALLRLDCTEESGATAPTHDVLIGLGANRSPFGIRCSWDGWLAGVRPVHDETPNGFSQNPLAGIFSGALAIREVFARQMHKQMRAGRRVSIVSLWEPWTSNQNSPSATLHMPNNLWLVGLGHLGQGIAWTLGMLPMEKKRRIILQDSQDIGVENEPTGLLVHEMDIGGKKTRSVARWLERAGWTTDIIERRHFGEKARQDDPAFLISGLDAAIPRKALAASGFRYMIDSGVGHGPTDFDTIQMHCLRAGTSLEGLWDRAEMHVGRDVKSNAAYMDKDVRVGGCGMAEIAGAGVAVPFVGAATGALMVSQLIRIASMKGTCKSFQLQMSCPDMPTSGEVVSEETQGLGGEHLSFLE